MQTLANIPLKNGTFHVQGDGRRAVGYLTLGTRLGAFQTACEIGRPSGAVTGRALTQLDIAPFDFAAAALNDVLQDAVGASAKYIETIGRVEPTETHHAFHVIMKSALGDQQSKQFMTDLVGLAQSRTNVEFTSRQQAIAARGQTASTTLASMTPDQVQKMAATYRHAYEMVQEALPALTEGVRTLLGQLRSGRLQEAQESMLRRYTDYYADTNKQVQDEVGRGNPVEHYTTGGAPINTGKYKECVGCTCADPCADGSCQSCTNCECSPAA